MVLATASGGVALAAAGAEEPEQRGPDGESSTEPDSRQEGRVDIPLHTVIFGSSLDGSNNDDGHGGDHGGGSTHSDCGDTADQVGNARDGATAVGEDAGNQLNS